MTRVFCLLSNSYGPNLKDSSFSVSPSFSFLFFIATTAADWRVNPCSSRKEEEEEEKTAAS